MRHRRKAKFRAEFTVGPDVVSALGKSDSPKCVVWCARSKTGVMRGRDLGCPG